MIVHGVPLQQALASALTQQGLIVQATPVSDPAEGALRLAWQMTHAPTAFTGEWH